MCRYVARPPLSSKRMHIQPNGQILIRLKRAWMDGTQHLEFSPIELLEKLAALDGPASMSSTSTSMIGQTSSLAASILLYTETMNNVNLQGAVFYGTWRGGRVLNSSEAGIQDHLDCSVMLSSGFNAETEEYYDVERKEKDAKGVVRKGLESGRVQRR